MPNQIGYRAAVAVAGFVMFAAVAGCGAEKETGTSTGGADPQTDGTTVSNASIVPKFAPGACAIQVGGTADMSFTVSNTRHNEPERLLEISTPVAESVLIAPGPTMPIPAGANIAVGPVETVAPAATADRQFQVTLQGVTDTAKPGKSVDVTFSFEKGGDIKMQVPVQACPTQTSPTPTG